MIVLWSSWWHCISYFIKIQNSFTFLVPANPGCPGIEALFTYGRYWRCSDVVKPQKWVVELRKVEVSGWLTLVGVCVCVCCWSPVYTIQPVVNPVVKTTGLTTRCIVYTNIQPVWQPAWQPAVSCIQPVVKLVVQPSLTTSWMNSGCLFNRFDNRLDVCLHNTTGCQTIYLHNLISLHPRSIHSSSFISVAHFIILATCNWSKEVGPCSNRHVPLWQTPNDVTYCQTAVHSPSWRGLQRLHSADDVAAKWLNTMWLINALDNNNNNWSFLPMCFTVSLVSTLCFLPTNSAG